MFESASVNRLQPASTMSNFNPSHSPLALIFRCLGGQYNARRYSRFPSSCDQVPRRSLFYCRLSLKGNKHTEDCLTIPNVFQA